MSKYVDLVEEVLSESKLDKGDLKTSLKGIAENLFKPFKNREGSTLESKPYRGYDKWFIAIPVIVPDEHKDEFKKGDVNKYGEKIINPYIPRIEVVIEASYMGNDPIYDTNDEKFFVISVSMPNKDVKKDYWDLAKAKASLRRVVKVQDDYFKKTKMSRSLDYLKYKK